MKRHKGYYFRPTDNPDLQEIVVIIRRPKPRSRIRTIMWWAANIKWDHAMYNKYN
jgi:hypothetical protein